MTMDEDESDMVEVEEEEIEPTVKERPTFDAGQSEIELEELEPEDPNTDVDGNNEDLVNLLIELSQNAPGVEFSDDDGEEVEEEEIEPTVKTRDPDNDKIYAGNMRDLMDKLIGDDEWEPVEPTPVDDMEDE